MDTKNTELTKFILDRVKPDKQKPALALLQSSLAKQKSGKLSVNELAKLTKDLLPLVNKDQIEAVQAQLSKLSVVKGSQSRAVFSQPKPKTVGATTNKKMPQKKGNSW